MHYYLWARLVRDPHLPASLARALYAATCALGVGLRVALVLSRLVQGPAVRPAIWLALVWMGVGFLLVAFLGIADAGRLAAALVGRLRGGEAMDPSRRLFLARSLAAGVG